MSAYQLKLQALRSVVATMEEEEYHPDESSSMPVTSRLSPSERIQRIVLRYQQLIEVIDSDLEILGKKLEINRGLLRTVSDIHALSTNFKERNKIEAEINILREKRKDLIHRIKVIQAGLNQQQTS